MHQTTYIKDPDTFRDTSNQQKKPDHLHSSDLHEKTLENKPQNNIHCPNGNVYACQICNRLRQVCPYYVQKNKTNVRSSSVHVRPPQTSHTIITPPRKVRVIEEIVYYPQIHNVIVHQQNPEKSINGSLNTTNPYDKNRHKSTAVNHEKFTSPIRVSEYRSQVLTPQQLKNLTESMIN